jgi:hypothetical protein
VDVGRRRLRLVGVGTALVNRGRQLGRAGLLLVVLLGGLVEMRAQAVGARGPRRVRLLLVLAWGDTLGQLLRLWALVRRHSLLTVCCLVLRRALVVYCQRLSVSARPWGARPLTYQTGSAMLAEKSRRQTGASDSTSWRRISKASQVRGRVELRLRAAGWSWRGGDGDGLSEE